MSLPSIRFGPSILDAHNGWDELFSGLFPRNVNARSSNWLPATDIVEEEDHYVIKADLPGFRNKDINMTLHDGTLTIKGERHDSKDESNEGRFRRVERYHGSFTRRFALPEAADTEQVSATNKDGVLEVTIQKRANEQPRRIEIQ